MQGLHRLLALRGFGRMGRMGRMGQAICGSGAHDQIPGGVWRSAPPVAGSSVGHAGPAWLGRSLAPPGQARWWRSAPRVAGFQ